MRRYLQQAMDQAARAIRKQHANSAQKMTSIRIKASEISMPHEDVICPLCDGKTWITQGERQKDRAHCIHCHEKFRISTGELWQPGLPEGEPEWHQPDDAELAWARSTMPGKAKGHVTGYRAWCLHSQDTDTLLDRLHTEDLVGMPADEQYALFMQAYREVAAINPDDLYRLESASSEYIWPPGEPVVAIKERDMPTAHGPGVYAWKELPEDVFEPTIYGEVALWGEIVEHEHGYRARYAYPQKLWVSAWTPNAESIAACLGRAYGVPCEVAPKRERSHHDHTIMLARQMGVPNRILWGLAGSHMTIGNVRRRTT